MPDSDLSGTTGDAGYRRQSQAINQLNNFKNLNAFAQLTRQQSKNTDCGKPLLPVDR